MRTQHDHERRGRIATAVRNAKKSSPDERAELFSIVGYRL